MNVFELKNATLVKVRLQENHFRQRCGAALKSNTTFLFSYLGSQLLVQFLSKFYHLFNNVTHSSVTVKGNLEMQHQGD